MHQVHRVPSASRQRQFKVHPLEGRQETPPPDVGGSHPRVAGAAGGTTSGQGSDCAVIQLRAAQDSPKSGAAGSVARSGQEAGPAPRPRFSDLLEGSKNQAATAAEVVDSQGNPKKEPEYDENGNPKSSEDEDETYERNMEDPTMFYFHGKWHQYSVKSLFFMDKHNKVRRCCVWLLTHRRFDPFIIFLIAVNSVMLGIKDYGDIENKTRRNQIIEISDRLFVSLFALECLIKVIGMGFIHGKDSYLREAANWLDFIVVVCSLLTEIPQLQSVSGLRTFRLMRPLRSLTTLPSMRILISTLIASVAQLGGVLLLAVFFFTIFAILGVSLWSGQVYQRCRLTEFPEGGDWVADPADTRLCSAERPCSEQRWCGSLPAASRSTDERYFIDTTKVEIYRDVMIPDLNYGYTNFNNLPEAFLTIFQCITLEGWIGIMHIYDDLFAPLFVDFFFLLTIVICSFFVLNLTIAVMLIKYEEFDKSEKSSTHVQDLYEYGEKIKLPMKFVEFVIDQDSLQISESGLKILKTQRQKRSWKNLIKSDATFDEESKYYQNCMTRLCFHIVNSPIFSGFIIMIIILNTVALAMDKHPQFPAAVTDVLDASNGVFTIIFTVEVVLKLVGFGVREYCRDRFNIFDAVIVIISILELALASEGRGFISALRALRLFRIFKLFRSGDLRTLIDSIGFTVLTIKDYTVLLALFIYVFALLGMSVFAKKVMFNDEDQWDPVNGVAPRINFDTLDTAALTVFEIMIGENWTSMMYDHMRSDSIGPSACVYFIALVCLGNVIMLNLFLAILLGNFDRARSFGEKKKIFESFDLLCNTLDYQLNIAIAYLFNDQEFTRYIEEKILKIDEQEASTEKDQKQQTNNFDEHSETEIREVFFAMTHEKMEALLTGELLLGQDQIAPDDELDKQSITELQRNRILKILGNIKKQNSVRRQREEFQMQVTRAKAEREVLEQADAEHENDELGASSDSDEEQEKSTWKSILFHIQTSSLLVFPQSSTLRKWCQMCVISDDGDSAGGAGGKSDGTQGQDALGTTGLPGASFAAEESAGPQSSPSMRLKTTKEGTTTSGPSSRDKETAASLPLSATQCNTLASSRARGMLAALKKPQEKKKNAAAKIFEGVILTLIVLSSLTLALDNPLRDPASAEVVFMGYLDNCFTILFTLEASIKIVALGFLFNNAELRAKGMSPYFRDPWNVLDFVVVVSSLLDFAVALQSQAAGALREGASREDAAKVAASLQSLKALRALRALRPLRMISRNQGMKLIVNALLASLPSMTNVTILCLLSLLIFAILGVGFYKGGFGRCSIEDPAILVNIKTQIDCENAKGSWIVPDATFDNTIVAIQTLLEMMSTEGWLDVMAAGIDAVPLTFVGEGADRRAVPSQPKRDNSPASILYFVAFMILGSQFILNLFVGVIMDNFNKIKDKEEMGSLFLTEDQRCWLDAHRLGLARKLKKKTEAPTGWRGGFYRLVTHTWFDNIITFFIFVNTLIMAAKYDGLEPDVETIFENLNYLFAFIFNMEMFLKLIGLGRQYFYSAFDLFDMLVVIGTDLGIILKFTTSDTGFSAAAPVVRAFRIMRIVRLVRGRANIRIILGALVNILPQITNFITLMLLLLFVSAALGLNVFSGVVHQEYVNGKDNFSSITMAMLTLFRCSTGEDWNKIMHELSISSPEETGPHSPKCIQDQDYHTFVRNGRVLRGCGSSFAHAYFLTFTVLVAWLIMNLSVAAVIEGLEAAKSENSGVIEGDHVQALLDRWMEYDPKATGWLGLMDFVCLVIELPKPFGSEELAKCRHSDAKEFEKAKAAIFNEESYYINPDRLILVKNRDIIRILQRYTVRTYEGQNSRVHFKDVYAYFVKKAFKESSLIPDDFEISKHLKDKMKNQWVAKHKKVRGYSKSPFKLHQGFASLIIAKYVRAFKARRAARLEQERAEGEEELEGDDGTLGADSDFGQDYRPGGQNALEVHARHLSQDSNAKNFDEQLSPTNNFGARKSAITQKFGTDQKDNAALPAEEIPDVRPALDEAVGDHALSEDQPPVQQFNTFMEGSAGRRPDRMQNSRGSRVKNKDENPQEFEEVGSQEEQSEGRALQQYNQNQNRTARAGNANEPQRTQQVERNQPDSMMDENEENLGIALGQSITDSHPDQSMQQLLDASGAEDAMAQPLTPTPGRKQSGQARLAGGDLIGSCASPQKKPSTHGSQEELADIFRREAPSRRASNSHAPTSGPLASAEQERSNTGMR